MSFFSFSKKNKESFSLVFNISSGSVSGAIIRFTEKAGVKIEYYIKEKISFQEELSIPRHVDLMSEALGILVEKIRVAGTKKIMPAKGSLFLIDRVFYIFSSPWCVSKTRTIRINEVKEFKVTEQYINKIIDEQEKLFRAEISESGQVVEKKIIQIKTNGYVVNDINDCLTKNLEISILFTIVPENILQVIESVVTKTFNSKNIWCHSLSLSLFSVIRNLFSQYENFIHLDITEEITDLNIINDNIITDSISIPFGRNHFIRELSMNLKITEEIADSMIRMQVTKSGDELGVLNLAVAMDTASQTWLTKISEALNDLKLRMFLPETMFLIISNDLGIFLRNKLVKQDFKVILVNNMQIDSTQVKEDTILKLELMFLDNLYKI